MGDREILVDTHNEVFCYGNRHIHISRLLVRLGVILLWFQPAIAFQLTWQMQYKHSGVSPTH